MGTIWPWVFGICNHCGVSTAWSRKNWKFLKQFLRCFGKTTPYGKIFEILFRKFLPPHRSTSLCWNVDGKSVKLCIIYRTKKHFSFLSQTVTTALIAPKILQDQPSNIRLTVFQISSKSVHFRQSYSRTLEGRFLSHRIFPWFASNKFVGTPALRDIKTQCASDDKRLLMSLNDWC